MAMSVPVRSADSARARAALAARLAAARDRTVDIASPLSVEDQQAQSMADASPTKWHLAHTTWFFETFVLGPHMPGFACFDEDFGYLFNSYYEAVGARHPRPARGLLTRPPLARVVEWRARTDETLMAFIDTASEKNFAAAAPLIELGIHHEEQHQELILMDVLHLLSLNPLSPAYADAPASTPLMSAAPLQWKAFEGGLVDIGHAGPGFAFDNEGPRHKVWLEDFMLGHRLVTNGEFLEFIAAGGYENPLLWLSDGWAWVGGASIRHPMYWREQDGAWTEFTLRGQLALDPARPVAHLSYFEADAYARFRGARLPGEAEWEHAAERTSTASRGGNLLETGALTTLPASGAGSLQQMMGDLWEWTASAYAPYPGFAPAAGAVGEYNGKFMSGQMVLKGGSFATPAGHVRITYRNFFYPHQRWMFSGLRLALGPHWAAPADR